jgi:hypothetical protein
MRFILRLLLVLLGCECGLVPPVPRRPRTHHSSPQQEKSRLPFWKSLAIADEMVENPGNDDTKLRLLALSRFLEWSGRQR